ncbi:MAG TPA: serine hydrolase [Gaiellaceae bacterium]|nr:serine hydrolase [Gaiellaceae bacterium]
MLAAAAASWLCATALAAAPPPDVLQASYDRARAAGDWAAVRRAELWDERPPLRLPARLPRIPDLHAHPAGVRDAALSRSLGELGRSFDGWAAFWAQDLSSGRTAGWNSDARFPAASTVKLAVLAAALRRLGGPGTPYDYDLRQLGSWSSNLAANRLWSLVGSAATDAELDRLGMFSSTYPGPYRAGTAFDAPKPPPQTHTRLTTAHDLGRALYRLQRSARGLPSPLGLPRARARAALRYLRLAWPGASLLRDALPPGTPVAEKDGWISDTRASAAIVYLPRGPVAIVVLAYRPGITLHEARALGERVTRLVRAGLRG